MLEITDALREEVEKNLERAKKFLLDMVKHPKKLDSIPNEAVMEFQETMELKDKLIVVPRDKKGKIVKEQTVE
ncbi:MAG: hypothetical protein AOA65_0766 [Candidatus Bathyarchaeota archaeon BA1]|nr:MAG: hypothetical protein AOA65_0766 [Candidatus Bathyarchaeota archaeon BA1]